MNKLSKAQALACSHNQGPALLIAGPGSGKTFTIIERIAYLITNLKVPPEQILVLTFSKAAANEIYNRYKKRIPYGNSYFGTFHSLAFSILSEYSKITTQNLISESQKLSYLTVIFKNHNQYSNVSNENLISFINLISKKKNSSEYSQDIYFSEGDLSINEIPVNMQNVILNDYLSFLSEKSLIDFDDMILDAIKLLRNNKMALRNLSSRYKYIIIDEFQDINAPQYELIRLLGYPNNNIYAVGDDDQSIYGFRGSNPEIMKEFIKNFQDAKTYYLLENYRSKEAIVRFAQDVISNNKNRFSKEFIPKRDGGLIKVSINKSRKEEEEELIKLLSSMDKAMLNDSVIILRTNREIGLYKKLLTDNKLIKSSRNKTSLNNAIITEITEDIISYFSYLHKAKSRKYLIRFMNKPERFIQRSILVKENVCETDIINYYKYNDEVKASVSNFFKLLNTAQKLSYQTALRLFIKTLKYEEYILNKCSNSSAKEDIIDYLEKLSKELSLSPPDDFEKAIRNTSFKYLNKIDEDNVEDGIRLITMHAAKGLEFGNVILLDVNEGVIPQKRCTGSELEEERRLLYVAITRAKDNLYIFTANERNRDVSRFIRDYI